MAAEYEVNIKINTQQIERELKKVDKAVNNIGKGKGGKKQPILALPSTEMLNATARKIQSLDKVNRKIALRQREINKQTRDQALSIDTLVKTQEKRARLLNKINEMEAKGLNVSRLRKQLAKATTEQSARRFGSAEKEFRVLEKSIRLEQSKLRILKEQRKGFASSPVRGTRTMMGSPAQIAAAGRQIASPIRGGLNFPGSPAFLAGATASRTPFGPSFPTGGAALPIRGSISMPGSPVAVQAAKATNLRALKVEASWGKALGELQETAEMFKLKDAKIKQSWGTALAELSETAALIQVRSQQASAGLTGQSSPVGGATNIPGSPAFLRRQRRKKTLEQVGLGAGFPLLFGGGAGSVLGGGLGGLTGSFGAQIALSALGQQIDQFVASMVNAGKALTSVGGAADFMAEKSLFSSDSMQFRIEKLIEEGRVTEAAALMTQEMAKQVGGSGLKALKDLGDEANKMGKLFNALILQVQAFISRALTPLLAAINKVVGDVVLNNQFNALMNEATGARRKEIEKFLQPFTKEVGGQGGARTQSIVSAEGKRLAVEKFGGQVIPEGAAIEPTGLELLRAEDKGSDKAAKDAERLARRLAGLEAERTKLEQLLQLDREINTAKLEGNNREVIALENKARLLEFAEKEAVIRASNVPQEQKIAELRNLNLERDRALLENAFNLDSFDKQKADDLRLQLEQLDLQLEAATAITREAENQAKLELLLLNLRESNKDLTEDQLEELMDKTRKLFQAENQGPLQSFITNSVKSLNDLEQHAVQVSQGIGNAIGNSLVNGMQNLITGAQSVKEVFADMLKSIADVLAQQAAQMIATYIAIGVARIFAGMGSGGGGETPPQTMPGASVQTGSGLNINGIDQFIAPKNLAAAGGYFGSPTNALIGEGGQGEYVIPESKMRESMARYSRGARGSSVIPDSGASGTSGEGGGVAVAAPIDVRYTVERINSVDYVTADQFQNGMRQAANQGAKQGEQQTLRRLQMSNSTRKRLGM